MTRRQPTVFVLALPLLLLVLLPFAAKAADGHTIGQACLMQPEELVRLLRSKGEKPAILMVGYKVMYAQAHIPGAEYIGPGAEQRGLTALREWTRSVPRRRHIVLYCGCCPWMHCPNVDPAFKLLRDLGFHNVKVLYLPFNFGEDWVNKGYPVERI